MNIEKEDSPKLFEFYQLIIDNVNDLICILENKHPFKIKFINESAYWNTLNYFSKDLINQSILNYIHPDDVDKVAKRLKKGKDKVENLQEIRLKSKIKKYIWFEFSARKIIDNNNQPYLLVILKNTTENKYLEDKLKDLEFKLKTLMTSIPEIRFWKLFYPKKYEEALKTSYEMLQNVIDNIPQNIFWKDINLVYLGCNKNYSNLIGLEKPENVIGETDKDLLAKNVLAKEKVKDLSVKEIHIIQSDQTEYHIIESWLLKNGKEIWFDVNRVPLHDSEGKVAGILVTYEDITQIKKAEVELKESEEKFRTISERSLLGIYILQDNMIKYANQRASETLGYSVEEMKSWSTDKYLKIFHPEDREKISRLAKERQIGIDKDSNSTQIRYIKISGKILWAELFAKSFQYKGKPAVLVSAVDITQKKIAEEKLIESEEKYRHLFESSPNMILLINVNRKVIDANTALLNYLGTKKEKIIERDFLELFKFSNDAINLIDQKYKELLKKGIISTFELQLTQQNEQPIWVNVQVSFIEIGIKTLIEIIMEDITYRKRSEEILQLNETRLEALLKLGQLVDQTEKEISNYTLTKIVELTKSRYACLYLWNEDQKYTQFVFDPHHSYPEYNISFESHLLFEKLKIWNDFLKESKPIINNTFDGQLDLFLRDSNSKIEIKRYMCVPILEADQIVAFTYVCDKETNYDESDIQQIQSFMDGFWKNIQRKRARDALSKSEKKYREVVDTSSLGVLEYDFISNDITYVNPKLLDMLGYNENDEFNVKSYREKIYKDDLKKFFNIYEKNIIEFRIYDKNGALKWLLGKFVNQYNEKGNLISSRIWLEDITEKKIYEELIFELNVNFLNFTTNIQSNIQMLIQTCLKLLNAEAILYAQKRYQEGREIYYLMDSENKIFTNTSEDFYHNLFISELFQENHDYTQTIFNIDETPFFNTDPYLKKYNAKVSYGKLIKSQNEFNSAMCVFFSKNPIISHQDKLVLFLICDAIEIEQRRWQVQKNLEEQNRFKSELLSRTSHELKTPLIAIKGFTELLLTVHKSHLDTDVISILDEIKEGSNRLERLINSLLKSSRLNQGQFRLNITTEDLSFLIKFCVKELQGLAELRKHKINLNIHEYLTCNFDKERIYEVVANILLNAIKYTPPGGTISIKSEIKEKFYVISIEDTGIGITEEEKSYLFKQFGKIERYGKGWDVDIEGSGLGLYISKMIVELHGGKIWAESNGRNKGSKFYFSLPIL